MSSPPSVSFLGVFAKRLGTLVSLNVYFLQSPLFSKTSEIIVSPRASKYASVSHGRIRNIYVNSAGVDRWTCC